jgi:hypothetical protein
MYFIILYNFIIDLLHMNMQNIIIPILHTKWNAQNYIDHIVKKTYPTFLSYTKQMR